MIDHLLTRLHDDPARIRAIEELEISALASHADTVNTYRIEKRRETLPTLYWDGSIFRWCQEVEQARVYTESEREKSLAQTVRGEDNGFPSGGVWTRLQASTLECHECDSFQVLNRSAREVAEQAYAEGYMVHQGNVLCRKCQRK